MRLSPQWVRQFVELTVDDRRLAEDLTASGIAVEGVIGSGAETVFEMEIGTNRPDAMNHYGVAREAAAIYDVPLKALEAKLPLGNKVSSDPVDSTVALKRCATHDPTGFSITVEEPQLCPRFSARVIRATTIKASPEKIAHRLQLLDQRPISNAVDATNYVLWEMGKPTHVFDMDLLEGGRLIIRKAKDGEKLKTLDGVERTLTSGDLVVADAKKPVGLAGVMGGFDTMITEKTRNILIESAWWDPVTVRKTSRRHGIHTDASHRFERGADFESTILSCDLVAALILESGGGELVGDAIDVVSRTMDQAPVVLRLSEVQRILGGSLNAGEVFRILKKLGFGVIPQGQADAQFQVHIPSWRLDVEREIDVIEEIARLHGYDKFENTLPAYRGAVVELPQAAMDATFRQRALALGYNEVLSLTFISHADAETFSSAKVLELENPLSEEASVMRASMAPGMLDMLAWNLNRDSENVRLFEMGRVYEMRGGEQIEPARACLGATLSDVKGSLPVGGALDMSKGEHAAAAEAFRSLKGDVENLLAGFRCGELSFDRETEDYFHPGRSARVLMDGAVVAQFGQISESVKAARKLRQDVFLAEIDLEQLHGRGLRTVRLAPLPKYPAVERDFSFVFGDHVEFEAMRRAVMELRLGALREFKPVEIFRGGSIGAGKYSILLRARLQSDEGTLRDEQIAQWSGEIVQALQGLGGVQRA
ncbi:MAG TPA: phenylalanine--tRNA ligase subunit beta [Candidatus Polarisedimenticolia bacterium]|nr:phenylalanine--tRNA ligase subunit beta [Candidatus Polarisedimenticolia bacterium]